MHITARFLKSSVRKGADTMENKALPGDTIVIINKAITSDNECEYTVVETVYCPEVLADISECIGVVDYCGVYTWLRHDSYKIVRRCNQTPKAQPGNRIAVTNPELQSIFGHEFTVLKLPNSSNETDPFFIWVTRDGTNDNPFWLKHSSYQIIGHSVRGPSKKDLLVSCQDCNDTGKIILFTSTVKCEKCDANN